jgi:hypothetical protein
VVNIMDENSSAMVADEEAPGRPFGEHADDAAGREHAETVLAHAAELLARPVSPPNPPEVQAAAAERIREYEERKRADEGADAGRSQRPMPPAVVNKAIDLREDELRNGRLALIRAKMARGERLTSDDRVELEADHAAEQTKKIVASARTTNGVISFHRLVADVLCDAAVREIALQGRIDTLEDRLAAIEAAARPRQAERPRIRVVAGRMVA